MKKYFPVFIILFILSVHSCKPKQNIVYMSNDNFEQEVSQAKYVGLHIQEGDKLDITVSAFDEIAVKPFNKSSMTATSNSTISGGSGAASSEYTVTTEGTIQFPVLGNIYCKGMTKQQLKEDLESRLKRYLTDPMVTITLTNFNFFVLGEVGGPGAKTSPTEKLNVLQAIAIAGDMSIDANKTNVKLIRFSEETGKDEVISLDLTEASIVKSPYYYIQQNDILYVEPDKSKQIQVNNSATLDKTLKYWGIAAGVLALILTITRIK
ncbi:MAG: polysaccharide export protein [Flavobacteriales bacterium]|nr:polysaccharide export protein [Flavobacteriales bacterium]MCA0390728.1 polysaccharide export protein [Bacteroidota bacterium]